MHDRAIVQVPMTHAWRSIVSFRRARRGYWWSAWYSKGTRASTWVHYKR